MDIDTFRYVIGVLLVIGLPPGLTWWFLVHPFPAFWRRRGVAVTVTTMSVFLGGGMVGLFFLRTPLMGWDLGMSAPRFALGVVLVVAAAAIGIARRKYLTFSILAGIPEVQPDESKRGKLLDQGPYSVIRHPRYVETLLGVCGYATMSNFTGPYVMAALAFPLLHLVVLLEERELLNRFGDAYRDYCERVPRYLPRWSGSSTAKR